ncbi:diacylglycerol/lipid kinase family protein [Actinokineospora sp.]|uniref:diacylglycerol/lipid kinase family protein n=1 Tax=Actinokineospora sp. TaxID=1872133 RepID=UPI0040380941
MTGPVADQDPTRVLVIANPTAGSATNALLNRVREQCAAHAPTTLHVTIAKGEATESVQRALAELHPPTLVVVIGGDGTVREVVEGMAGTPTATLMIIPGGTGNSAYRMLWAERPWSESLAAVFTAPGVGAIRRRLDLGRLEETSDLVFLGACSGVVAEALVYAKATTLTGRARYAKALADAAAAYTPYPGRVTVDGKTLHEGGTVLANVGGGRYRGGQYLLLPMSELADGLLDVVVIGDEVPIAKVPDLVRNGDHLGEPGVFYGRGSRIEVWRTDGEALVFEHDGELRQDVATSMTLQVSPGALPVWCDPVVVPATVC